MLVAEEVDGRQIAGDRLVRTFLEPEAGLSMSQIHFIVEESPEGGYLARAVGVDIFTEVDDLASLQEQVRDAVHCHFDATDRPGLIRLHITREEVIAA